MENNMILIDKKILESRIELLRKPRKEALANSINSNIANELVDLISHSKDVEVQEIMEKKKEFDKINNSNERAFTFGWEEVFRILNEQGYKLINIKNTISKKEMDYTKTISFWTRLEMFVHNVKVNDLAGEEEKQMLLHNCKEKQKMFIELESKHHS